MENITKIITGLMANMPEEDRKNLIKIATLTEKFMYHIATYEEVAFSRIWRDLNGDKNFSMASEVAEELGLELVDRLKTKKAKKTGKAWIKK